MNCFNSVLSWTMKSTVSTAGKRKKKENQENSKNSDEEIETEETRPISQTRFWIGLFKSWLSYFLVCRYRYLLSLAWQHHFPIPLLSLGYLRTCFAEVQTKSGWGASLTHILFSPSCAHISVQAGYFSCVQLANHSRSWTQPLNFRAQLG